MISDVQQTFDVALSLSSFVENGRTVAELAELVCAESDSRTDDFAPGQPLHFIFADVPSAMSLRHFAAQWDSELPVHALIPEQPGGRFDLSVTIEQHASQALSMIRVRQPDGPLALVGYSIGGLVAYEVARQAVDAGQQVEWLGILDMVTPPVAQRQLVQQTLAWRLRRIRRRPARERRAKYKELASRLLRTGSLRPENHFDYRGARQVAGHYERAGHQIPMHLFVCEATAADAEADLLGWDEFHRGTLTVDHLAGDHVTMLERPGAQRLAQRMLEILLKARASTRVDNQVATLPSGRHRKGRRSSSGIGPVGADASECEILAFPRPRH
jgi:thioesterase domain-containing protein